MDFGELRSITKKNS